MKSPIYIIKTLTTEKILAMSSVSLLLTTLLNMRQILLALAIIIVIDMLTGIRKSLFIKGVKVNILKKVFWHAINSNGIRQTWRKTYEYAIGIIVFVVLDSLVLKSSAIELMGAEYTLSEIAVALACMVEIYSIYENMEAVSGRNLLKRLSFLLPRKLQKMFFNKVEIQNDDEDAELPPNQNYD